MTQEACKNFELTLRLLQAGQISREAATVAIDNVWNGLPVTLPDLVGEPVGFKVVPAEIDLGPMG